MTSNKVLFLCISLILLNFLDIITTQLGLSLGLNEFNPIYHILPFTLAITFKMLFPLILTVLIVWFVYLAEKENCVIVVKTLYYIVVGLNLFYVIVVVNNVYLIWSLLNYVGIY